MNNAKAGWETSLLPALNAFFPKLRAGEFLAKKRAGFSGNAVYEIELSADSTRFCLKAVRPQDVAIGRLAWIHAVLHHVASSHPFVPSPCQTVHGKVAAQVSDTYWELTPWMPGEADYLSQPSRMRIRSAAEAVAKFHQAAARFSSDSRDSSGESQFLTSNLGLNRGPNRGQSPGIQARLSRASQLLKSGWQSLEDAVQRSDWPDFVEIAQPFLRLAKWELPLILPALQQASSQTFERQPVIRDLWHEHVLFTDDTVTGIIDFDAMQIDARLLDLTRLFADLAGRDDSLWEEAIAAYDPIYPLPAEQMACLRVVSLAGVILSGVTWIEWIAVERRQFAQPGRVLERFGQLLKNLSPAVS